jgi:hypothetical protein
MKTLTLTFTFLFVHMLLFTALSAIGAIFSGSFISIITNGNWFFIYSILFCCIPIAVTAEVHDILEKKQKYY